MKWISIIAISIIFIPEVFFAQTGKPDLKLKVVIIRHAEKPSIGDNLCPKGLDRANLLPAVLDKIVGVPDYTYIPQINNGKSTRSVRMLQTVTPFAVLHNLILNSDYKNDDVNKLAADILKKAGVVLVVWEHSQVPDLIKALGIAGKQKWKDEDYGSIWIVEFSKKTAPPVLRIEQENINPKGKCE